MKTTSYSDLKIPACRRGGKLKDVRGYFITSDMIGQWAVIQWGSNCLGTGETAEEAMTDAEVTDDDLADHYSVDGDITLCEIEEWREPTAAELGL